MAVDFVQKAEFLKAELDEFYRTLQQGKDQAAAQKAIARLQAAVNKVEAFAEDPGPLWEHLPLQQRWGYLKLASRVGTATHELKQLRANGEGICPAVAPRSIPQLQSVTQ